MHVLNLHQLQTSAHLVEQQNQSLFAKVATDLTDKGYSIQPFALPLDLSNNLLEQVASMSSQGFVKAGIGRLRKHTHNDFVRRHEKGHPSTTRPRLNCRLV